MMEFTLGAVSFDEAGSRVFQIPYPSCNVRNYSGDLAPTCTYHHLRKTAINQGGVNTDQTLLGLETTLDHYGNDNKDDDDLF